MTNENEKQGKITSFKVAQLGKSLDDVCKAFDEAQATGKDVFEILGITGLSAEEKRAKLGEIMNVALDRLEAMKDH